MPVPTMFLVQYAAAPSFLPLTDLRCCLQVADFNLSRIVAEDSILSSAQATNPRWLAPEVLNGDPASQQSVSCQGGKLLGR